MSIKVALAGAGAFGIKHLDAIQLIDGVEEPRALRVKDVATTMVDDTNHFRIVTLPWAQDLTEAIERIGNFLSSYKQ